MTPPIQTVAWSTGAWTNPPVATTQDGTDLLVTAAEGSDAWRTTSYGFIHDSEHALLAPFPRGSAVEVEFTAAFSEQFDQAGIFIRANETHWIKAGVEFSDGLPQLGAVVTNGMSDWSVAPVPEWLGRRVLIRISRSGDALTVRAGLDDGDLRMVRLIPFPPDLVAQAGPFVCAPTRAGLTVPFHTWRTTPADETLH